ncbi:gamma-glutamyltransferase [Aestuariirhabdus litorea]|uniref:Glutathione hydrolase proenzyme n=1 Tax=Aestuariirhabdus litorea TaxID=2528527 RepID=A0A3P3VTN3_9GAMM|nr:gamma-glutamyltransferase [Aestuariirhabdus litorea]RRJ84819.1 gamma-glutamyltransferase [Aestuariirhabdus litorea]RWW98044.1 gamma-glutamyltransferase [Endozoicomonadaceae bacterium GTF-13]
MTSLPPPLTTALKQTAPLLLALLMVAPAGGDAILEGDRAIPQQANAGMVVTSHTLATQAALEVLADDGNAIDAAVTAGFVLAVVQPRSGNIGGGGFMLIANDPTQQVVAIDYRETAPAAATRTMFIDAQGEVDTGLSRFSHLSAGVPGTVDGLLLALERYGSIDRKRALAPAIKLAREGFIVPPRFTQGFEQSSKRLLSDDTTASLFYKKDGTAHQPGERFTQPQLAATLTRIAEQGREGFYAGETARLISQQMKRQGGLISAQDLANYRAKVRKPLKGRYRGYEIYSMPPPSSGGVHIIQMLELLEPYPIAELGHNSARTIHLMAEAMKLAYADRATHLGDSDFVAVPVEGLLSNTYIDRRRQLINSERATPSSTIQEGNPAAYESEETTHFSVADRFGNLVSNTYTLNFSYGSGISVAGAGFLLNNQMDDFSAKPGSANAYGLTGADKNSIAANKRMLSSMSPTIVRHNNRNLMATGTPGGPRIITTTLQVIMNVLDHGMNIQEAVNAPRVHHQWLPDSLRIESGISPDTRALLTSMGYQLRTGPAMGASQSIYIDEAGIMQGAADPRRDTSSAMGLWQPPRR